MLLFLQMENEKKQYELCKSSGRMLIPGNKNSRKIFGNKNRKMCYRKLSQKKTCHRKNVL